MVRVLLGDGVAGFALGVAGISERNGLAGKSRGFGSGET